jgi:U2-associated protein SR140
MEKTLEEMFQGLNASYMSLESRLKAEGFKMRVMNIFRAWEDWTVYPRDFLKKLQNIFLGLPVDVVPEEIDGAPMSDNEKEDEDLDGVPLDGAALLKGALLRGIPDTPIAKRTPVRGHAMHSGDEDDYDEEIDGIPCKYFVNRNQKTVRFEKKMFFKLSVDEDIDGIPMDSTDMQKSGAFIPSKWETVDPDQVEAQAITTSKWETLEPVAPEPPTMMPKEDVFSDSDDMFEVDGNGGR